MIENNRNNEQIYGRNDMIMLDQNNKIYGSLGLADKYVMKTEEGTMLALNNPKLGKFGDVLTEFNIYGRSSQFTTTGKNLLKYPYIIEDDISQGIIFTDNKDGSISISGTATGTAYYNLYSNIDGKRLTLASGTYKLVVKGGSKCDVIVSNDVVTAINQGTFTITDGHNEIYCYIVVQEGLTVDETVYPMIQLASITDESYEPYTGGKPSPSPDYPQEIKSVGDSGSVERNVRGKNLWDNFKKISLGNVEQKNGTYISTADTMQVDITGSSIGVRPLLLKANNAYTFSLKTTVSISSPKFVCLRYTNGESNNIIFINKNFVNFVPERDVEKIGFVLYESVVGDKVYDVQLEMGSEATSYEPYYEEQTVTLPYTLNAIPVAFGGNVTIDGQQYIADYVDLKCGKYVQNVTAFEFTGDEKFRYGTDSNTQNILGGLYTVTFSIGKIMNKMVISNAFVRATNNWTYQIEYVKEKKVSVFTLTNAHAVVFVLDATTFPTKEDFVLFLKTKKDTGNPVVLYYNLSEPIEQNLTQSEIQAYQNLVTYAGTNIVENNYNAWMKATYKSTESV